MRLFDRDGFVAVRDVLTPTQLERMQQATEEGLRPATEVERRFTIACIHNASHEFASPALVSLVSQRSPDEMHSILAAPDVNVTNTKDKETMLTSMPLRALLQKMHPLGLRPG